MRLTSARILVMAMIVAASTGSAAHAQSDARARRDQVAAATGNAVASLRDQINQIPLTRNYTVGQYLDKLEAPDQLNKLLQRAEQIGGPRWVDDQTCQVRLEISGERVANAIAQIAAANAKISPVPAEVVPMRLKSLAGRRFAAIGSSTGGATVEEVQPPQRDEAWANVDHATRRQAVAAAKRNAIQKTLDSLRPITLGGDDTVGDALAIPKVNDEMTRWLSNRPVTRIEFGDERQVDLTLAADPSEAFDVFRSAVANEKGIALPHDDKDWDRVRAEFVKRMVEPVGHGAVPAAGSIGETSGKSTTNTTMMMAAPANPAPATISTTNTTALVSSDSVIAARKPAPLVLPERAPVWSQRAIEAQGTAAFAGTRLKTARAAETEARRSLKSQLEALPFDGDRTLGAAAQSDDRVKDIIKHAARNARVSKTDYHSDGSVAVQLWLDAHDVWSELTELAAE